MLSSPPPLTPAAARAAADLAARALVAAALRSAAASRHAAALVLTRGAPAVAAWLVTRAGALLAAVRTVVASALARGGGLAARAAACGAPRLLPLPGVQRVARTSLAWAGRAVSLAPRLEFGGGRALGVSGQGDVEACGPSPSPARGQPPPRHALALVFAGGLLAVEVSVPRLRRQVVAADPPPPAVEGQAAEAPGPAPAAAAATGATTPPPPLPRHAPVRSSADALRHLASFAALTTENARSPTPGAAAAAVVCSPPLRRPQLSPPPPSNPLRESTSSINCLGAAAGGASPDAGKAGRVLTSAATSPRLG